MFIKFNQIRIKVYIFFLFDEWILCQIKKKCNEIMQRKSVSDVSGEVYLGICTAVTCLLKMYLMVFKQFTR